MPVPNGGGGSMLRSIVFGLLIVLIGDRGAGAQTKNVKDAIDVIVLFCVAGGDKFEISGAGKAEGGLAFKKFGATGEADINISKSEARGLVDGLRQEMSKLTAEQASEARKCMQPYIDRILNLIVGSSPIEPKPILKNVCPSITGNWYSSTYGAIIPIRQDGCKISSEFTVTVTVGSLNSQIYYEMTGKADGNNFAFTLESNGPFQLHRKFLWRTYCDRTAGDDCPYR
jgi:hypothetical protein